MRRRDFIAGLGGAAGWPVAAQAQQRTSIVGIILPTGTPEISRLLYLLYLSAVFRQALKETGFVEGQNVTFEFRDPALAADLVGQHVDLIYVRGLPDAIAAKAATATIPIVPWGRTLLRGASSQASTVRAKTPLASPISAIN